MLEPEKVEPVAEPKPKEEPLWDRLHNELATKLGPVWFQCARLEVRFDELYWLVFLAEHGIKARELAMNRNDMSDIMSIAS